MKIRAWIAPIMCFVPIVCTAFCCSPARPAAPCCWLRCRFFLVCHHGLLLARGVPQIVPYLAEAGGFTFRDGLQYVRDGLRTQSTQSTSEMGYVKQCTFTAAQRPG